MPVRFEFKSLIDHMVDGFGSSSDHFRVQFELGSKAKISAQVRFERFGQVKFTFGSTIKFEVSPTLLKTIV